MLCLSRRIDYALIALADLAQRGEGAVASARDLADANQLPQSLLMNILKRLHRHGIVRSVRGANGGYVLRGGLDDLSLYDLIGIVEDGDPMSRQHRHGPVQALQYRLVKFLRDVTLSDLVMPGRRIDVPLERVGGGGECCETNPASL
jgi:Rrf2 family iron-sulfur cluster assembly transcriptional regulator